LLRGAVFGGQAHHAHHCILCPAAKQAAFLSLVEDGHFDLVDPGS
jgi:hypothetical protein